MLVHQGRLLLKKGRILYEKCSRIPAVQGCLLFKDCSRMPAVQGCLLFKGVCCSKQVESCMKKTAAQGSLLFKDACCSKKAGSCMKNNALYCGDGTKCLKRMKMFKIASFTVKQKVVH